MVSEFYVIYPLAEFIRWNRLMASTLELTLHHLLKMEPTQCSETSAFNTQTPGKYPENNLSSTSVKLKQKEPLGCLK